MGEPLSPLAPAFDTITRPFLRPLRRYVPPGRNVDLTPRILLVILYVVLIVVNHLRVAAAAASILEPHVRPGPRAHRARRQAWRAG